MMFDPPDYPYKDLSEYDNLLENKNVCSDVPDAIDETIIKETSNNLSFQSNDSGRYFSNIDSPFFQTSCVTSSPQGTTNAATNESLLTYESTLLDENTVNQFLLPLQETKASKPETDFTGPDLLALHSCAICHEIFTSESDLLDHTIAFHASIESEFKPDSIFAAPKLWEDQSNNDANSEAEWLICRICQRVLSTVLETEPTEQLCCLDLNGACNVGPRKLTTMFVCDGCSGLFADGEALDKHRISCYIDDANFYVGTNTIKYEEITAPQPELCFKCDFCGIQCMSVEELKFHLIECKRHARGRRNRTYTPATTNKMWNCGSCNQLFVTARELYRHKRGEDRPQGAPMTAYVCDECDKVLGSMCALHTHKKMHKTTKPGYPCKICGRRFNQSGHLAIHMRMHTGERPYPCDLCTKAFKVKVERDDHRRTHTGERPFACAECPKTFTAAARLREHARIHTDQRPYRCDICGAAFRRPYARTVHTLIHTGEKPHECDVCGTAFRRSGDMWKHKRTLHGA